MNELRRDRTNGFEVVIAPERGLRPLQPARAAGAVEAAPAFDPSCPFCPGNERDLAGIVEEVAGDAPPGWRVRVVPNRYPAFSPARGAMPSVGAPEARPAGGRHEVIIETPRHDGDIATLEATHLNAVLRTCRHRHASLLAAGEVKAVLAFRNHGRRAGASVRHPHSQVVATDFVPPRLAAAAAWARRHHAAHGSCATCDEIEREMIDGCRVVEATERFLVVVPYAAASPLEQGILPRRHRASFAEADDAELAQLGPVLQRALGRLGALVDGPSYNYVVESVAADRTAAAWLHWSLRIVPGLVQPGGFELGAGLPINPSLPEDDADRLRSAPA